MRHPEPAAMPSPVPPPAPRPLDAARTLFARIEQALANERVCLALLWGAVLVSALAKAAQALARPFWYDELLTIHVASLGSPGAIVRALRAGADGMPVAYDWWHAGLAALPLDPHLAHRLSPILGYLLAMAGAYAFIRRRNGPTLALAGALLMAISPFERFAVEARPYALVVGLVAVAAALWQRADERPWLAAPMGLTLALATAAHYASIAAIGCFCAAELTVLLARRRFRPGIWLALAAATAPFLAGLPLLLSYRAAFSAHFWSRPTWAGILGSYGVLDGISTRYVLVFMVLTVTAAAALALGRASAPGRAPDDAAPGFTAPELALGAGFLLYPFVLGTLALMHHAGYAARYAWPHVIGFVFAFVWIVRPRLSRAETAWLTWALLVVFLARDTRTALAAPWQPHVAARQARTLYAPRLEELAAVDRDDPGNATPIVITSGIEYLPAAWYMDASDARRCWYLADAGAAVRLTGADTDDLTMEGLGRVLPGRVQVADATAFIATHRRFVVWADDNPANSWLTPWLLGKGFRLRLLGRDRRGGAYLAEAP